MFLVRRGTHFAGSLARRIGTIYPDRESARSSSQKPGNDYARRKMRKAFNMDDVTAKASRHAITHPIAMFRKDVRSMARASACSTIYACVVTLYQAT